MFTYGAPADGVYTGAAYEGVAYLPALAEKIHFLLKPLFGFSTSSNLVVPIIGLGSAAAAMGLVPQMIVSEQVNAGDLAVFTGLCITWSGILSTHNSMMDALGHRKYTPRAVLYQTLGGLLSGTAAHWLFLLLTTLGL